MKNLNATVYKMKIVSLLTFIILITFFLNVHAQSEKSVDTYSKFAVNEFIEHINATGALMRSMTNINETINTTKNINPQKVSSNQFIKERFVITSEAQANKTEASRITLLNTTFLPVSNSHIASAIRSNQDVLDLSLSNNNIITVEEDALNESNLNNGISQMFSLSQNYPNPFNPETKILFNIVKSGLVKLIVYDIVGKEIETLVNENLQIGMHEVNFNGSRLSSGVYYYKLEVNGLNEVMRMTLIK